VTVAACEVEWELPIVSDTEPSRDCAFCSQIQFSRLQTLAIKINTSDQTQRFLYIITIIMGRNNGKNNSIYV
jgi:hypothetical protein